MSSITNIKKTKKICKNYKQIKQQIKVLEPMRFSDMCRNSSISIISSHQASTSKERQGEITLNQKLEKITTWRLKMNKNGVLVNFGICQVFTHNKRIGEIYGQYSAGYWPVQNRQTSFSFKSDTWVQLTYNPQQNSLQLLNESTNQFLFKEIPEKKQGFEYYPYVYMYKATTVYLQQELESADSMNDQLQETHQKDQNVSQDKNFGKSQTTQKSNENPIVSIADQTQKQNYRFSQIHNILSHKQQKNSQKQSLRDTSIKDSSLGLKKQIKNITQCNGCKSINCPLRIKNILHCWKCGKVGFYITTCPICNQNKLIFEKNQKK